ncbi:DUF5675 family protein [Vibrio spartinae]|uniref:DUF5675 domain-containing protein n=1 Tax=Vibrio spartinae TaxID=1918945 RepID=A0A1N6M5W6_9VIBR|nr:DUF5675 family protein [Vibrio spartinae]SIO94809.1 hypothetical protein VSP9026_02539 [Vibrio spartinae]
MKTLILYRRYFEHGTYSVLCDEYGSELTKTIERPWLNNQQGISCIPEGIYTIEPTISPKFGHCYALTAPELGVTVNGPSLRTHILFHAANLPEQLEGCIAPGMLFGVLRGKWAVLESKNALQKLENYLGGEKAQLMIKAA